MRKVLDFKYLTRSISLDSRDNPRRYTMEKSAHALAKIADLRKLTQELEDLNSQFPATKEFLQSKGLENVRDLNEHERKELLAHLAKKYRRLLH